MLSETFTHALKIVFQMTKGDVAVEEFIAKIFYYHKDKKKEQMKRKKMVRRGITQKS